MKLKYDLRLLEVSMELSTLGTHLELIEDQVERGKATARSKMESETRDLEFDDEADRDFLRQEYYHQVDFVLPRVLRNPFLVSLFAVYESAATEIANLIQHKKDVGVSIDDLKGDILHRSKKYYEHILHFQLSKDNSNWQRLMLLSDLRNVIAHTNGRLDMVSKGKRDTILKSGGVREELGCLVVDGDFLKETFALVKNDLEGLVERYKQWDTEERASLHTKG